ELHPFLAASLEGDAQRMRIQNFGESLQIVNTPVLDELSGAASQAADDRVLEIAKLVEIDLGSAEFETPRRRVARFAHQLRDMQECLGGNAAAIDANATRVDLGIDECDLQTKIRGEEGRRIATRSPADHCQLCREHSHRPMVRRRRPRRGFTPEKPSEDLRKACVRTLPPKDARASALK